MPGQTRWSCPTTHNSTCSNNNMKCNRTIMLHINKVTSIIQLLSSTNTMVDTTIEILIQLGQRWPSAAKYKWTFKQNLCKPVTLAKCSWWTTEKQWSRKDEQNCNFHTHYLFSSFILDFVIPLYWSITNDNVSKYKKLRTNLMSCIQNGSLEIKYQTKNTTTIFSREK